MFAESGFPLREESFDGGRVGTIRRPLDQGAAGGFADAGEVMAAEIVHHHDVAGCQRRGELLLNVGKEQLAVHRAVDHQRSGQAGRPQRAHEGRRLPMSVRDRRDHVFGLRSPAVQSRHLRVGSRFIEQHVAFQRVTPHQKAPPAALRDDIRPPSRQVVS